MRISNKLFRKTLCALILLPPFLGRGAYPSVEETIALFSPEKMNSTNVLLSSAAYLDFENRPHEPAPEKDRQLVEDFIVSGGNCKTQFLT